MPPAVWAERVAPSISSPWMLGEGERNVMGMAFMELYVLYNFRVVGLLGATVTHLSHKLTE